MALNQIEMTREELIRLIDKRVQRVVYQRTDTHSMNEILEFMQTNLITPEPGEKTGLDILLEERKAHSE